MHQPLSSTLRFLPYISNPQKIVSSLSWQLIPLMLLLSMDVWSQTPKATFIRPQIIVTTDITNEPDDQESLIRLLLYANDFDIKGLIGSTGVWKLSNPATHVIHECIDGYAKVWSNLLLHDSTYPSPEYLHNITVTGNQGYGMSHVSERGSAGSRLIIETVDASTEPVWLLVWGGANTVAQAIWTIAQTRSAEDFEAFKEKIRVYDLAGQDDAGAWIAKTYPEIFLIRNVLAYKGMSFRFSSEAWDHTRGGNETVVTREWVKENIQDNHGPLGGLYPDAMHLWEGDSPTYLYLLPNGLNNPEEQWQGSWGGRFTREKQKNVNIVAQEYAGADCSKGCFINELPYADYWLYADAEDTWSYAGRSYTNQWAPIFRWRTAFQHDFAARMDWCVSGPDETNHPPVVVLEGDNGVEVQYFEAIPGEKLSFDAGLSKDPDGDILTYHWWVYPEAGTYQGKVIIEDSEQSAAHLTVPQDLGASDIHLILSVTDDGAPSLTRYRRVVISGK